MSPKLDLGRPGAENIRAFHCRRPPRPGPPATVFPAWIPPTWGRPQTHDRAVPGRVLPSDPIARRHAPALRFISGAARVQRSPVPRKGRFKSHAPVRLRRIRTAARGDRDRGVRRAPPSIRFASAPETTAGPPPCFQEIRPAPGTCPARNDGFGPNNPPQERPRRAPRPVHPDPMQPDMSRAIRIVADCFTTRGAGYTIAAGVDQQRDAIQYSRIGCLTSCNFTVSCPVSKSCTCLTAANTKAIQAARKIHSHSAPGGVLKAGEGWDSLTERVNDLIDW